MKILNLYAGIGGNRKLWSDEHEITAVEYKQDIADVYKQLFPNDTGFTVIGLLRMLFLTMNRLLSRSPPLTGTYQAGWSTHWGCDDCPLRIDIQWHDKENINHE